MKNLQHRMDCIEARTQPDDDKVTLLYAKLRRLPRDYVGERHTVLVKGWPSTALDVECELEERPGSGPELHFDSPEPGRRAFLVGLVASPTSDNAQFPEPRNQRMRT
jgi:hypothetical protein